jgi:hypothetical protein
MVTFKIFAAVILIIIILSNYAHGNFAILPVYAQTLADSKHTRVVNNTHTTPPSSLLSPSQSLPTTTSSPQTLEQATNQNAVGNKSSVVRDGLNFVNTDLVKMVTR